jgi:DNA-directed RNA polymerase subunit F
MSEDEGDRAIESLLSGNALPKGDTVAEGKAPPSEELSDDDGQTLVIDDEDDGQPQETAQAPAQPVEPGDDILVTLSDGQKISLGELKRSPFLQRDYTFKTESHKKAVQEFEAWKQAEAQRISQHRDFVLQYAQQRMPQEPDPSMMDETSPNFDPIKYWSDRTKYEREMGQLNAMWQEQQQELQARQQQEMQNLAELKKVETAKLHQALPKLKDPQKEAAFMKEIVEIMPHFDVDPREIFALQKAGHMRIVDAAIKYWKAVERGKAVVKELPAKPKLEGRQRSHPASDLERDAQGRFKALRETGSVAAADAAIEAFLLRKG